MTQERQSNTVGNEVYGLRNTTFQRRMVRRSAEKQAAFLLPHLRPGMRLLDCGCGPGSITIGLARVVAPGAVVGIDIDPGEIERAKQLAAEQGIANVQFETGNVYELPFADGSFDAAFSNALLDHLIDPVAALREMRRILKADGMLGVRTADRDGYLLAPRICCSTNLVHGGSNARMPKAFVFALARTCAPGCAKQALRAQKVQLPTTVMAAPMRCGT
ncbi:MAG: methyltransferase domain-containing protein [Caldilineaceae bacterium]